MSLGTHVVGLWADRRGDFVAAVQAFLRRPPVAQLDLAPAVLAARSCRRWGRVPATFPYVVHDT